MGRGTDHVLRTPSYISGPVTRSNFCFQIVLVFKEKELSSVSCIYLYWILQNTYISTKIHLSHTCISHASLQKYIRMQVVRYIDMQNNIFLTFFYRIVQWYKNGRSYRYHKLLETTIRIKENLFTITICIEFCLECYFELCFCI